MTAATLEKTPTATADTAAVRMAVIDAAGKVPGSMLMQDDDGTFVGAVIVSFEKWADQQPVSVTGGMQ